MQHLRSASLRQDRAYNKECREKKKKKDDVFFYCECCDKTTSKQQMETSESFNT